MANGWIRGLGRILAGLCIVACWFGCFVAEVPAGTNTQIDPYTVNSWTTADRLPGNAFYAISPTRDGYLWAAGVNGLVRFDGVRFVRFRLWEGLPTLQMLHLLEDRAGRLWIGTEDAGVIVRENGHFSSLARTNGLGGDGVRGLTEDSDGRVWVAHDQGLARWDGARFVDMELPRDRPKQSGCRSVFCGSKHLWALGDNWTLYEWRDGKWEAGPRLQKTGFRFDRVFETRDGRVWAQLYPYGLGRLEGEEWQLFGTESGLEKSYITAVLDLGSEGLLCGTYEHGLSLFHEGHAAPAQLNQPLELDGVLALQEDKLGNIWVGTRTQGLLRLRKPRVRVVAGSDLARIARMAFDYHGRFWIGSAQKLWFEQEGKFVQVPQPANLPNWTVSTLTPCPDGGMWIGVARSGLWEFDPDRHERPIQKMKGANDDVMGVLLAPDAAGGFWFGNESGTIGRLRDQKTNLLTRLPRPADKRVVQLMGDSVGGVWARVVGTGMIRLDGQGEELERVGPAEGLPVNSVRCWLSDGEGGLFMGSPMGLYWWHKSKLLLFDTRHGLPEDAILNMVDDRSGRLWCASHNLLFRLTKKDLEDVAAQKTAVVHPRVIGPSAGLKTTPFAAGIASRAIRGPDGRLYFPGIWNAISLDPADFDQPESAPEVRIEEVFVDGRRMDLAGRAPALRFPAGTEEISVRYTALQSMAPETLRFRYRFEGTDKDWSEAGDQRVVNFRRLPPGPYQFRVSAASAGGEWAEPGATINWRVEPFVWQTSWFRAAVALAGAAAVAGLVWKRLRILEQRRAAQESFSRRLLETQEVERRRIAAELHDGLGQNLVLVKNLTALHGSEATRDNAVPRSAEIAAAAERALEEVHAISYALRPPELDRLGLAKAIAAMVRRAGEASEIRFQTQLESDGALPNGADIQLFRIAQEAVNNLVKHSGAKTARVELWFDEAGAHLVVADDGRGLPAAKRESGNGLGLPGIQERARLIGAQCKWLSQAGNGTTLSVLVPLRI